MPDARPRPVQEAELAIHLALLLVMLWWSFVMSMGADLVHSNRGFSELARLGSDAAWSRWLLAVSIAGALGLVPRLHRLRMASRVALSLMHSALAVLLSVGAHMSTGAGCYTVISLLGGYLVWCETQRSQVRR